MLWGWGEGAQGQLGQGRRERKRVEQPLCIPVMGDEGEGTEEERVVGIACGGRHSLVVTGTQRALRMGLFMSRSSASPVVIHSLV